MFKGLKKYLIVGITTLTMAVPALVPAFASTAFADVGQGAGSNVANGLCSGITSAAGNSASSSGSSCNSDASDNGESTLEKIASRVVNIFSLIVGVAAVVMIVFGGFRYITSGGDSGKVGNAKNTLVYALVGLIIVALSQALVHFVLNQAAQANNP